MATLSEGSDRVDYVRIRVSADAHDQVIDLTRFEDLAAQVVSLHKLDGKPYDVQSHYDPQLKRHVRFFNIWGEAADYFFDELPATITRSIIRLDYRMEAQGEAPPVRAVYDAMERTKRGGRNTKTELHNSPIRQKRGGRDAGGQSAVSGGKDSDKRLSYYYRGHSSAALEGQFGGAYVAQLIQNAYNAWLSQDGDTFHDCARKEFYRALNALTQERVGCSADTIVDGQWYEQEGIVDTQESLLEWMDDAWGKLTPEAKQSFLKAQQDDVIALAGTYDEAPEWATEV